jgi:hypothetical protein
MDTRIKHPSAINNVVHSFLKKLGKLTHNHPMSNVIQAVNHAAFLITSGLYSSSVGHRVNQNGITTILYPIKEMIGLSDLMAMNIQRIGISNPINNPVNMFGLKSISIERFAKYAVNQNHRANHNAMIQ